MNTFRCSSCSFSAKSQHNLNCHLVKRHNTKPSKVSYKCRCALVFPTINEMVEHQEASPTCRTFATCRRCGHISPTKGQLNRHMLSHTDKKPHVCVCEKAFTRRDSFRRHYQTCRVLTGRRFLQRALAEQIVVPHEVIPQQQMIPVLVQSNFQHAQHAQQAQRPVPAPVPQQAQPPLPQQQPVPQQAQDPGPAQQVPQLVPVPPQQAPQLVPAQLQHPGPAQLQQQVPQPAQLQPAQPNVTPNLKQLQHLPSPPQQQSVPPPPVPQIIPPQLQRPHQMYPPSYPQYQSYPAYPYTPPNEIRGGTPPTPPLAPQPLQIPLPLRRFSQAPNSLPVLERVLPAAVLNAPDLPVHSKDRPFPLWVPTTTPPTGLPCIMPQ